MNPVRVLESNKGMYNYIETNHLYFIDKLTMQGF